jgi:hypothetical protein
MTSERQIGYAFLVLGVLIVMMLAPSSSSGQIISDQSFGPSSEPLNEGVIVMPQEAFPKELDQRFERSMHAPEISSETTEQLLIKTPDQQDMENARESDLKSAVSF